MSNVRRAEPDDLAKLEALKLAMSYPDSLFHDEESYYQTAVQRLRDYLAAPDELPDWRLLLLENEQGPAGYLLFTVDHEHGVTQQLQAVVIDFAVFSFEDLESLTQRARRIVTAFENEYLVTQLPAGERRLQLWFYRCGFRAEQQRVARLIPRGHQGPSSSAFRLRPVETGDLPFLVEVHSAYAPVYLPAGRQVDPAEVELHYQMTYLALDLSGADGSHYLILEEVSSGRSAGYLLLKKGPDFGPTPSFYVYDVAIAPEFAGRGLSLYLKGAAETLTGRQGGLLYGDGSRGTPALASWHEKLGYPVDSVLFALKCSN